MSEEGYNDLPPGWVEANLSDLIGKDGVFTDGDWVESKDQDPNGDVRLIQLADVGEGYYRDRSNRFLTMEKAIELNCTFLEIGDVLVARMPDPLGRACIFPGDEKPSVTVVDVCIIRSGENGADHEWLMHTINSSDLRREVENLARGTTRKRISRKNLGSIRLPLPPLPEQRRIVEKIEALFAQSRTARQALDAIPPLIQQFRQSVLAAAFRGELTERDPDDEPASVLLERIGEERRRWWEEDLIAQGKDPSRRKYKEPEPPDTTNWPSLPELPSTWVWTNLGSLIQAMRYGSSVKADADKATGVPVLRMGNIQNGKLDLSDLKYISPDNEKVDKYILEQGDILINRTNSPELVGKSAVFVVDGQFIFASYLIRVRVFDTLTLPEYLTFLINSPTVQNYVARARHQVTGQANINSTDIKNMPVALAPVNEQRLIVERISSLFAIADQLEAAVNNTRRRVEVLNQAILARAFRGELVPQDPADEPASVLLGRTERER